MMNDDLVASYQLIAELLLSPGERNPELVTTLRRSLESALPEVDAWIGKFLGAPGSESPDEYLQTLELSPPCPLYMGAYLFDEPSTCNGVGSSARNSYMIELSGLYRHFGFEVSEHELPDFVPAMIEFLSISLEHQAADTIGLRRRYVQLYVQPGLQPLHEALAKYDSPYVLLIAALESAVEEDVRRMGDAPAWMPAGDLSAGAVSLPILSESNQAESMQASLAPTGACP